MTFFKDLYRVIRRELGIFARNRNFAMMSLVLPLLVFFYFIVLMSKGVAVNIPVGVIDYDKTPLSRQLTRMIDATASVSVDYRLVDIEQGKKLMREGKIDAVVEIPRDFEKDIYGTVQTRVIAYISGTNVTKNGSLDRDIRTTVITFSSGVVMQRLIAQGVAEHQAMQQVLPINYEEHILFNPFTNYGYYLLPIFLAMSILIFAILCTIFTFANEFKLGTAPQWLAAANGNIFAAFVGKALPYTVIFSVLNILVNLMMFRFLGVPMRGSLTMLLLNCVLFIMAYQSIGVMIVSWFANLRLSLSIGGGYSVLGFTFSGMTFPAMAMDPGIRIFTHIFPLTFYMDVFVDQAMRGAPAAWSLNSLGALFVFIFLPLPFLPRMKRMCNDSKYWGRM